MATPRIPAPLFIKLYDPMVGKECIWRLIDYKAGYLMFEYESQCSGRTIMLPADVAWEHAYP